MNTTCKQMPKSAEWQTIFHLTLGNYLQSSGNLFQLLRLLVIQNKWQITSEGAKNSIIKLCHLIVSALSSALPA
jgi:hypothetical protein